MKIPRFLYFFVKRSLFFVGFYCVFLTFSVYALSLNIIRTPVIISPSLIDTGATTSTASTSTRTISPETIVVPLTTLPDNTNTPLTREITTPTTSSSSTGSDNTRSVNIPSPTTIKVPTTPVIIKSFSGTTTTKRKISKVPVVNANTLFKKSVATKWTFTKVKPAILDTPIGATLKLCGYSLNCYGDVQSTFRNSKSINVTLGEADRYIKWTVDKNIADSGILEISYVSMGWKWPSEKVFYSQNISYGESKFDFENLLRADEKQFLTPENQTGTGAKLQSTTITNISNSIKTTTKIPNTVSTYSTSPSVNKASKVNVNASSITKMQPTFYVRVIPMKNGKIIGKPTNEVKVKFNLASSGSTVTIYSPIKAYEVKIKSFKPLLDPTPGVCRWAVILDTPMTILYGTSFKQYNVWDRICPTSYKWQWEPSWYESLWSAITSGISWVSQAYNSLKSGIIDAVGSVACGWDETCKKALAAGLDIGMVALGIPPTLPNFDQLAAGGFDYLAGELSAAAGCPDAVCRDMIKDQLKKVLEEKKNKNPSCSSVEEAHKIGIEPLCFPDWVKSHFDPLALYRDATIILTVKRTNASVGDEQKFALSNAYRLQFKATAKNATSVGHIINNIEPHNKSVKITDPLEWELFQSKNIPIPYIAPWESIDIPLQLVATDYWVPGHKEAMDGRSTVIFHDGYPEYQYNDWWLLYLGANLNINVNIDGCKYQWGNECIISNASKNTIIPKGTVYQ